MNITQDQLPYQQFERLGIQKEGLHGWPNDEMKALLSGFPGRIKFLTFKDGEGDIQKINARLSVYRKDDGNVSLKVHPYRRAIKNDLDLTQKQLEELRSGTTITKNHRGHRYLVQLDQSINELRSIRIDRIKVADKMGNTRLSTAQKESLLTGKILRIRDAAGNEKRVRIDLSSPSGWRVENRQAGKHPTTKDPGIARTAPARQEQVRMKR